MRENFDEALQFTLQYEGGYVNDPLDPGGPTNMGITLATLSHEFGRQARMAEICNLSVTQASEIYRKKFWNAIGADALPPGVDALSFDIAVNMGVGRALRFLYESETCRPVCARIEAIHDLRMGFWKRLAIWARFGRGWTRRGLACRDLALKRAAV
jgi:lysozyme family protein